MKKILIVLALFSALSLHGCRDYLDINYNPNFPEEVDSDLLLPAAYGFIAHFVGVEFSLFGNIWGQYATQATSTNQYRTILYNTLTSADNYFTRVWLRIYANAMPALIEVGEKADEGGDDYLLYKVISEVMMVFTMHMANSGFDEISWEEAFQGDQNTKPKFHSGKEGYELLIERIEKVLELDVSAVEAAASVHNPNNSDYVFGGNARSWMKFANSLYLKLLLRDPTANQSKISSVLSDARGIGFLDETSGDASMDVFSDETGKRNPLYEYDRVSLNTPYNLLACETVAAIMEANGDPRISEYMTGSAPYRPAEYGSDPALSSNHDIIKLAAEDPVYFVSVAETYFLMAEAYARLGQTSDAKTAYDNAVTAAFDRWGMGEEAADFIGSGGAYEFDETASTEAMIEQIITQKWLSAFRAQTWDAWFDINRTGYPARGTILVEYTGQLDREQYPKRFLYPNSSRDYNENAPKPQAIYAKMWWHK